MGAACTKLLVLQVVDVACQYVEQQRRTYKYDPSSSSSSSYRRDYSNEENVHVTEIIMPSNGVGDGSQFVGSSVAGGASSSSSSRSWKTTVEAAASSSRSGPGAGSSSGGNKEAVDQHEKKGSDRSLTGDGTSIASSFASYSGAGGSENSANRRHETGKVGDTKRADVSPDDSAKAADANSQSGVPENSGGRRDGHSDYRRVDRVRDDGAGAAGGKQESRSLRRRTEQTDSNSSGPSSTPPDRKTNADVVGSVDSQRRHTSPAASSTSTKTGLSNPFEVGPPAAAGAATAYERQRTSGPSAKSGSPTETRRAQTDADEQALLDLTTCRRPESWRGCQPMSQWLVHNSDPMVNGWRVLEVQFFSDRNCNNLLKWSVPLSAGFLTCGQQGQGFAPVNGMDNKKQTQWISSCGTESRDCDGVPATPPDPEVDMCRSFDNRYNGLSPSEANYRGSYIGATFASPQAVQCVRLLQAGSPYRSDKVTITSHNQNDCYICAHGAMPLADAFSDGLDTYIGTPGLKLELFTNLMTWGSQTPPPATKGSWPTSWEGVVKTDNLNVTTNSSDINFPLSAEPWRSGWPHPRQHYIARWQGLLRIMESGPYKFLLQCDTEARMYFGLPPDQSLVMQNNGSATQLVGLYYESEIHMELQAGVRYFEVQYKHLYEESMNERNGIILSYKGPDTIPTETTTTTVGMPVRTKDSDRGRPTTTPEPPGVMDIALWKVLPPSAMMRGITDDDAVSNSVYIVEPKKHCHDIRYRIFGDRPAAQAACDADNTCGGIYGTIKR
mmetsp:Transcript_12417/g.30131  ORF Transcript_12417/g.30131 Transcript_12417/m.30131 type:complete len:782 (+) Transcript_12417:572-2917(+)